MIQTDLQTLKPSPLPWNFDNGAYLKDANGKTIGDFRYKNARADVDLILSSIVRTAQPKPNHVDADLLYALETAQMALLGVVNPNEVVTNALLQAANTIARVKKKGIQLETAPSHTFGASEVLTSQQSEALKPWIEAARSQLSGQSDGGKNG